MSRGNGGNGGLLAGWRPALRLAWRDAVRSKGRSSLVLAMIALPVLAVTAAAVIMATSSVDGAESTERRMGAADALVFGFGTPSVALQDADPEQSVGSSAEEETLDRPFDVSALDGVLGREVRSTPFATGYADIRLGGDRVVQAATTQVDLADPLAEGLFELREGRLPSDPGEVVINRELAERGVSVGDTLDVESAGTTPTVVGIGEDATYRGEPTAAGPPGSLSPGPDVQDGERTLWLVDAGGEITWPEVREVNETGGLVLSRAVLADPPSEDELAPEVREMVGMTSGGWTVAPLVLVVTMALVEIVLLAGPAFAVGARRQSRTLALMAACGGTPRQARRDVLASGVVLGAAAAVLGALAGLVAGLALLPAFQRFSAVWFGPFEVPALPVLGVAVLGLLSALLAAIVPAAIASRQDVVAVLAGRRGDRAPSRRSPLLGLVLLGVGAAGAAYGATRSSYGETPIAASAIVAVLGMILIVPVVVSAVARLAGRLPLSLRYAARDAARHRTRTVPAVAAVAATVAGVVALGIAASSDERQNEETYTPQLAMGDGSVSLYPDFSMASNRSIPPTQADWEAVGAIVRERVPDVEELRGVASEIDDSSFYAMFTTPDEQSLQATWGGIVSSSVLVADDALPGAVRLADESDRALADRALREGRAVVLTDHPVSGDEVEVSADTVPAEGGEPETERLTWPAVFVETAAGGAPAPAVAPTSLVEDLGPPVVTAGLYLPQPALTADEEEELGEEVAGISVNSSVYVERGYQQEDEAVVVLLILGGLGGVLMLGGTLTATFLALSDARPDLATLSAVGASPRKRRMVAASYALVVGGVGALMGAAVGFVPGLAIVRPLTYTPEGFGAGRGATGPFYDVPWLLIVTLVVALPLITALVVGLTARSRLPLAARLQ